MYGLPENVDLGFLRDRELLQVCVGTYQVILHFDSDVSLSIESDVGLRDRLGSLAYYHEPIPAASATLHLLSTRIQEAWVVRPGTLVLRFSNGETLEVYDSNADFESYQLSNGNSLIVV